MSAVDDVVKAWTDPGPVPVYHRYMQAKLRKEWPVLGEALDVLASVEYLLSDEDEDPWDEAIATISAELKILRAF